MTCLYKVGEETFTLNGLSKYLSIDDLARKFNMTMMTEKEVRTLLKKWLPNLDDSHIQFITGIANSTIEESRDVFGEIKNAAIRLYGTSSDTFSTQAAYHEALHLILRYGASKSWRERLFNYARNKYGNLSEYDLEHHLAEELSKFEAIGEIKSWVHKIFKSIISFLRSIIDPSYSPLKHFYDLINAGYFRSTVRIIESDYAANFSFLQSYFAKVNTAAFERAMNTIRSYYYLFSVEARLKGNPMSRTAIETNIYIQLVSTLNDMKNEADSRHSEDIKVLEVLTSTVSTKDLKKVTVYNLVMKELFPSFKRTGYIPIVGEDYSEEDSDDQVYSEATEGLKNETLDRDSEDLSAKLTSQVKSILNSIPLDDISYDTLLESDKIKLWYTLAATEFVSLAWSFNRLMEIFSSEVDIATTDIIDKLKKINVYDKKTEKLINRLLDIFKLASEKSYFTSISLSKDDRGNPIKVEKTLASRLMFSITPTTKIVEIGTGQKVLEPLKFPPPATIAGVPTHRIVEVFLSRIPLDKVSSVQQYVKSGLDNVSYASSLATLTAQAEILAFLLPMSAEYAEQFLSILKEVLPEEDYSSLTSYVYTYPNARLASLSEQWKDLTNNQRSERLLNLLNSPEVPQDVLAVHTAAVIRYAINVFNINQTLFNSSARKTAMNLLDVVMHKDDVLESIKDEAARYHDLLWNLNATDPKYYRAIDHNSENLEYHVYYSSEELPDMSDMGFYELESLVSQGKLIRFTFNTINIDYIYSNIVDKQLAAEYGRSGISALFNFVEAREQVRELHNLFSSVVEKNYLIGRIDYKHSPETNTNNPVIKYYVANGYGLNAQVYALLRDSIGEAILRNTTFIHGLKEISRTLNSSNPRFNDTFRDFLKLIKAEYLIRYNIILSDNSPLSNATKSLIDDLIAYFASHSINEEEVKNFLDRNRSRITSMASQLTRLNPLNRASSVLSGKKDHLYKYTVGSYAFEIIRAIKEGNYEKFPHLVEDDVLKLNPLLKIINDYLVLHDSQVNAFSGRVVSFQKETKKFFFLRTFMYGFIANLNPSVATPTYYQFTLQPSSASRIPAIKLPILSLTQLAQYIRIYNRQLEIDNFSSILAKFKSPATGSLMKFDDYESLTDEEIVSQFISRIEQRVLAIKDSVLDLVKTSIPADLDSKYHGLLENETYSDLLKILAKYSDPFTSLLMLAQIMNYVNGYFFNQLLYGDLRLYADSSNLIKRGKGPNGPAIHPKVGNGYTPKESVFYVVSDEIARGGILEMLNRLFDPEIVKDIVHYYDNLDINLADAQGIMSSKRLAELTKGYGNAFKLGKVHKPLYFGPVKWPKVDENGNVKLIYSTGYFKYTSVSITPELTAKYPFLAQLDRWMISNGIGEIVFSSVVKVSLPNGELPRISDIVIGRHNFDRRFALTIYNDRYGMQFNAAARSNSGNVQPSQLISFLNLDTNRNVATMGSQNLAKLMYFNSFDLIDILEAKGLPNLLKTHILRKDLNEHLRSLIVANIDVNIPFLVSKAVIQTSAEIFNRVYRRPFSGGKLLMQSAITVGRNLSWRKLEDGTIVADVIVPASLLHREHLRAIKEGRKIYPIADGFGVRIPTSSYHSAVVYNIVDVNEGIDVNVIIVPDAITAVAGSDFDGDALFSYVYDVDINGRPYGFSLINGVYQPTDIAYTTDEKTNPGEVYKNRVIYAIISSITSNPLFNFIPISKGIFMDPNRPYSAASVMKNYADNKADLDLLLYENAYLAHRDVRSGKNMIGIMANFLKIYSALAYSRDNNTFPSMPSSPKVLFNGTVYELDRFQSVNFRNELVVPILASLLNLALDNEKDQFLSLMNVNEENISTLATLLALGLPVDFVTKLFLTDTVKELTESGSFDINLRKAYRELVNQSRSVRDTIATKLSNMGTSISAEDLENDSVVDSLIEKYALEHTNLESEEKLAILAEAIGAYENPSSVFSEDMFNNKVEVIRFLGSIAKTHLARIRKLSTIMTLNRTGPVTIERFMEIRDAVTSLFGSQAPEILANSYYSIYDNIRNGLPISNTLNYLDSTIAKSSPFNSFFSSVPHVAVNLMTVFKLESLYAKNLVVFNEHLRRALEDYTGIYLEDSKAKNVEALSFLYSKYLFTVIANRLNPNLYKSKKTRDRTYLQYGLEAMLNDLAEVILRTQIKDLRLSNNKLKKYGIESPIAIKDTNLFLSQLVIRKDSSGIYTVNTHSAVTLTQMDYFVIRKSFYELRKYEYHYDDVGNVQITVNPDSTIDNDTKLSSVQEAIINYIALNSAISSGLGTFGLLLPPKVVHDYVSRPYTESIKKYFKDGTAQEKFLQSSLRQFYIQLSVMDSVHFTMQGPTLQHYIRTKKSNEDKFLHFYTEYSGKIMNVDGDKYFDLLLVSTPDRPLSIPENKIFGFSKNRTIGRSAPLFVNRYDNVYLLVDVVGDYFLYQSVGKKRSSVFFPLSLSTYNPYADKFSSSIKTITTIDARESVINLMYSIDDLVGKKVYLVLPHDALRTSARLVTVTKSLGRKLQDIYSYEVEDVPSESREVDLESPSYAIGGANFDTDKNEDPILSKIISDAENLELGNDSVDILGRPASRYYVDKVTGIQYERLTHPLNTVINSMRARPYEKEKETTFAEDEAEKLWEGKSPDEKLLIPTISKEPITKQEFITRVTANYYKAAIRGTIAHLYIQKNLQADQKLRDAIQRNIDNYLSIAGLDPRTMAWVDIKWRDILSFNDVDYENGKILSEVAIKSDIWKMASTVDLLVKNLDGTYTIVDFKFGKFFSTRFSARIWKFGRVGRRVLFQTPKEQAKLEVMLRALILKTEYDIKFKNLVVPHLSGPDFMYRLDYDRHVDVESHLAMIHAYLKDEYDRASDKQSTIYGKLMKLPHFNKLFDPSEYTAGYSIKTIKESLVASKTPLERFDFLSRQLIKHVQFQYNPAGGMTAARRQAIQQATELVEQILDITPNIPDIRGYEKSLSILQTYTTSGRDSTDPMVQLVSKLYDRQLKRARDHYHVFRSIFEERRDKVLELYYQRKGIRFTLGKVPYFRRIWTSINPIEFWEWAFVEETAADGTLVRYHPTTKEDWEKQAKKYPYLLDSNGNIRSEYTDLLNHVLDTYDYFFVNGKDRIALANQAATYRVSMTNPGQLETVTNIELATSNAMANFKTKFVYKRGKWFPIVPITPDEFGHFGLRWANKKYRAEMYRTLFTWHNESVFENQFNNNEMIPMRYLGNPELVNEGNYSLNVEEQFFKFTKYHLHKQFMDPVYAIAKALQYRIHNAQGGINTQIMKNFDTWVELFLKKNINGLVQRDFEGGLISRAIGRQTLYGKDDEGKTLLERGGFFQSFNYVKLFNFINSFASASLMWIKPFSSSANGIFSYMYALKEALKGELTEGKLGRKLKIDPEFLDFKPRHLAAATMDFLDLQRDAILGKLEQNKLYILVKKLGYMPEESQFWSNIRLDNRIHRGTLQDASIMYLFQSLPEEYVAMIILSAQLRAKKVKALNKSFWEMYEVKRVTSEDGKEYWDVVWKDNYVRGYINASKDPNKPHYIPVTGLTSEEVRRLMFVYQWMYGNYRHDERIILEYYVLGKLFLVLKRYIPTLLRRMFMSKGTVDAYGQYYEVGKAEDGTPILKWKAAVMEGRWRTIAGVIARYTLGVRPSEYNSNTFGSKLKKLFNLEAIEEYSIDKLSDYQKQIFIEFVATAAMVGATMAGFYWIFGPTDDMDEREKIIAKYYFRILMNFSQDWNFVEPVRDILQNGLPVSFRVTGNFIQGFAEMSWALFMWPILGDEAALTQEGHLRGTRRILNTLPIVRSYIEVASYIAGEKIDVLPQFTDRPQR